MLLSLSAQTMRDRVRGVKPYSSVTQSPPALELKMEMPQILEDDAVVAQNSLLITQCQSRRKELKRTKWSPKTFVAT